MNPLALLPILGLAVQYAPKLIGLFGGEKLGDAAESVVDAFRKVVGTDDPAEAKAKLDADPALADALKTRLDAEVAMHQADLADVANARAMQQALVAAQSKIARTPVVLSVMVVLAAIGFTVCLFFVRVDIPERLFQLLNAAYGAIWLAFGQVMQFWIGSSRTSQQKDAQLTALTSTAVSAAANSNVPSMLARVARR